MRSLASHQDNNRAGIHLRELSDQFFLNFRQHDAMAVVTFGFICVRLAHKKQDVFMFLSKLQGSVQMLESAASSSDTGAYSKVSRLRAEHPDEVSFLGLTRLLPLPW